jgi:hypothetical protein
VSLEVALDEMIVFYTVVQYYFVIGWESQEEKTGDFAMLKVFIYSCIYAT